MHLVMIKKTTYSVEAGELLHEQWLSPQPRFLFSLGNHHMLKSVCVVQIIAYF